MEASGEVHNPAVFTPGKVPPIPFDTRLDGSRADPNCSGKK